MTSMIVQPLGAVVDAETPSRAAAQTLRNTLRVNGSTSVLSGLAALVAAVPIDRFLGTDHPGWVRSVGVGLALFAAGVLAVTAASTRTMRRWTPAIVTADVGWVAATAATVAAGWYDARGAVLLACVGALVGCFAARQWSSHRRLRLRAESGAIDERPPVEVVHVEAQVRAPTSTVWPVVVDHDLYGRLAPNLSAVHATSGDGAGLVRVCANRRHEEWTETCTLWEEGHRFEIAVDTTDYPYPLAEMRGSWWVEPSSDGGTIVGMDFRYQPRRGVTGAVFAALMQAAFPFVLRRILRGWRRAALRGVT